VVPKDLPRADHPNSGSATVKPEKRYTDVVRVNYTLYRIILGLVHGRNERPPAIAERVTKALEKLAAEKDDPDLTKGHRQFQKHIETAFDLIE
jgi:hypothetical protein